MDFNISSSIGWHLQCLNHATNRWIGCPLIDDECFVSACIGPFFRSPRRRWLPLFVCPFAYFIYRFSLSVQPTFFFSLLFRSTVFFLCPYAFNFRSFISRSYLSRRNTKSALVAIGFCAIVVDSPIVRFFCFLFFFSFSFFPFYFLDFVSLNKSKIFVRVLDHFSNWTFYFGILVLWNFQAFWHVRKEQRKLKNSKRNSTLFWGKVKRKKTRRERANNLSVHLSEHSVVLSLRNARMIVLMFVRPLKLAIFQRNDKVIEHSSHVQMIGPNAHFVCAFLRYPIYAINTHLNEHSIAGRRQTHTRPGIRTGTWKNHAKRLKISNVLNSLECVFAPFNVCRLFSIHSTNSLAKTWARWEHSRQAKTNEKLKKKKNHRRKEIISGT